MNYKRWLLCLFVAGVAVMAISAIAASPAGQEASGSTVAPDQPDGKAPVALSPEERERLLSLTRVVVASAVKAPGQKKEDAAEFSADEDGDLAKEVEALDLLLGKLSRNRSQEASELMMKALDSSEPSMRITSLHWLAGRDDVGVEALSRGIGDRNSLVREVAENLLIARGASDEAIERVRAAREKGKDDLLLEVREAIAAIK